MANQFEGKYKEFGKVLHVVAQSAYGTFKVVDPDNEGMWWGGFKTVSGARRYGYDTLGADHVRYIREA